MPQPRSSGRRASGDASSKPRTSGSAARAKSPAAAKSSPTKSTPAKSAPTGSTPTEGSRSTSAAQRSAQRAARRPAGQSQPTEDLLGAALDTLRDHLERGIVLTGARLQETLDDAVARGRITRDDAEDLVGRLLSGGRQQTEDLLSEVEQVLGRSRLEIVSVSRRAGTQARRSSGPDRVLREVDRARRMVGIGPSLPILGYDDLVAAQVSSRLVDLSKPELRRVRDHERRHANRKSVLAAIEDRLSA